MDIGMAKLTLRPILCEPGNRTLLGLSKGAYISHRIRCDGNRGFVKVQRESLRRSEVLELLSIALDTLLLPENQKRLRQRLGNSNRSREASVEVLFPTQIVEQGPSKATKQISVEGFSSTQCGNQFHSPGFLTATTEAPEEIYHSLPSLENPSIGILNATSDSPMEDLSRQTRLVQEGSSKEPCPSELVEIVHQDIQRMLSTSETGASAEDISPSTMSRLKTLDVHSYVHKALRESFLRSYMRSRKIEE